MVVRGNKKLTCRATATEEEINKVFAQSDKTDKLRSEWQAKGSPWTEDDEAFLNRMSAWMVFDTSAALGGGYALGSKKADSDKTE